MDGLRAELKPNRRPQGTDADAAWLWRACTGNGNSDGTGMEPEAL